MDGSNQLLLALLDATEPQRGGKQKEREKEKQKVVALSLLPSKLL